MQSVNSKLCTVFQELDFQYQLFFLLIIQIPNAVIFDVRMCFKCLCSRIFPQMNAELIVFKIYFNRILDVYSEALQEIFTHSTINRATYSALVEESQTQVRFFVARLVITNLEDISCRLLSNFSIYPACMTIINWRFLFSPFATKSNVQSSFYVSQ